MKSNHSGAGSCLLHYVMIMRLLLYYEGIHWRNVLIDVLTEEADSLFFFRVTIELDKKKRTCI